ncbi:hypothetical protein RB653_000156 [Dictyostelium firmibasis]|uniref:Dolichyl-diphosphooligosaccharide--protein glycosyltransferase subunit KCP2 n=1 Tax=Dictyostelium firmibasis TaxID=79012 RepID=A0AAN7UEZ3_9MYCE
MASQPTEGSTALISLILWVIVFALLNIGSVFFKSSEAATILGGFVGSLLFFLQITFIGAIKRDVKTVETIISVIITAMISSTIHRVSGTTSIIFSIGWIFYLNHVSNKIYSRLEETNTVSTGKKRK